VKELLDGTSHLAALTTLTTAFGEVKESGAPAVVWIDGGPGIGKSRVLLEFYRQLVDDQPDPAYWPEPDSSWVGFPPEVTPGQAPMTFFWWGIVCPTVGSAKPFQIIADEISQIEAHADRLLATKAKRGVVVDELVHQATEFGIAAASDLVPGGSTAVTLARSLIKVLGERHRLNELLGDDRPIDAVLAERRDIVDQAVRTVELLSARVPVVVAIDDAHAADPSLGALVARVVELKRPILVAIASQPAAVRHPLAGAYEEDDSVPITPVRLVSMEDEACERIIGAAGVRGPVPVVAALVDRSAGNPRSLLGLLGLVAVVDGTIQETVDDVLALPDQYADQLRAQWWTTLDPAVRKLLAIGATLAADTGEFLTSQALDGLSCARTLDELMVASEVLVRATRLGWLLAANGSARFAQPQHLEVARALGVIAAKERATVYERTADSLRPAILAGRLDSLPYRVQRLALDHYIHTSSAFDRDDHDIADLLAVWQLSELADSRADPVASVKLKQTVVDWAEEADLSESRKWEFKLGLLRAMLGLTEEQRDVAAAEALVCTLKSQPDLSGARRSELALHEVVTAIWQEGPSDEHIKQLRKLATDAREAWRVGEVGPGQPIGFLSAVAFHLNSAGRHVEALEHYDEALKLAESLPQDQRLRLLLNRTMTIESVHGALVALKELHNVAATAQGSESARLRLARLSILARAVEKDPASCYRNDLAKALEVAEAEVGSRHPIVITAGRALGAALATHGDWDRAANVFGRIRPLQPSSESHWLAMCSEAWCLNHAGRDAEALPILERTIAESDLPCEQLTKFATLLVLAADAAGEPVRAVGGLRQWVAAVGQIDDFRDESRGLLWEAYAPLGGNANWAQTYIDGMLAARSSDVSQLYLSEWAASFMLQSVLRDQHSNIRKLLEEAATLAIRLGHVETFFASRLGILHTHTANDPAVASGETAALVRDARNLLGAEHPVSQMLANLGNAP
jgi:tetratricopeptide (TPR) repeat protein